MLNVEKILRQDRLLRATTGLNRKAFSALLSKFEQVYLGSIPQKEKPRKRKIGAIPDKIPVLGDLGFQGVQKQYVNIHLPDKKPKGGELTIEQKQKNAEGYRMILLFFQKAMLLGGFWVVICPSVMIYSNF